MEVAVEGRALRIPDLPADARMAKAQLEEVQAQAAENLAFLDGELAGIYRDQAAQLAEARRVPRDLEGELGSRLHEELWSLVRDPGLKEGETVLRKAFLAQMEAQRQQAERDRAQVELKAEMAGPSELEHAYDWQAEERSRHGALRTTLAWQGTQFLEGFRPAWAGYSPKLEAYIQASVRLLSDLEAKPQPPSTRLLGRLLRLQLMERCRTLIAFNAQVWALAAAKVLTPKSFSDASVSGIRAMNF
jgi:hypothetical protein